MLNTLTLLLLPALLAPQAGPETFQKLEETLAKAKSAKIKFKLEMRVAGAEQREGSFDGMLLFKEGRLACMTGISRMGERQNAFSIVIGDGRLQSRTEGRKDGSVEVSKDYASAFQTAFLRGGILMAFGLTSPENPAKAVLEPLKALEVAEPAPGAEANSLSYKLLVKEGGTLQWYGETLTCTLKFDPADHTITSRQTLGKKEQAKVTFTEHYVVILDAELPDKLFKLHEPEEIPKKTPKPGGWKPTECTNNQYTGDLTDAKVGRWMTYRSEAGGSRMEMTTRIVGKADANVWIESWMDVGSMKYGFLFQVGPDRLIKKAWAAADGDPAWVSILVKEPPKGVPGDGPKPALKESAEKKEVKAGSFDCTRLDVSVVVGGKEYKSTTWYSKDLWNFGFGKDGAGMVAMEASGTKMSLESKGEDANPTIPLPKE